MDESEAPTADSGTVARTAVRMGRHRKGVWARCAPGAIRALDTLSTVHQSAVESWSWARHARVQLQAGRAV
jgi:hypothetical protein